MVIVAAASTAEPATRTTTAEAETSTDAAAISSGLPDAANVEPQRSRGGSKWVIDEKEVLHSTFEHRAWTYGCMALLAGSLGEAAGHVQSVHDAGVVGGAVLAAYVLSDLGTAVFHWGVDNYGEPIWLLAHGDVGAATASVQLLACAWQLEPQQHTKPDRMAHSAPMNSSGVASSTYLWR